MPMATAGVGGSRIPSIGKDLSMLSNNRQKAALYPPQALDPKLEALLRLKLAASVTYLYEPGIRQHIQAALRAGATRAEIFEVIKLSTVIGIHSVAVGLPILNDELAKVGIANEPVAPAAPIPVCDTLRSAGGMNPDWEPIYDVSPDWLESFLAAAAGIWRDDVLPLLWIEFLCIVGDASVTHMYSSGTRRHIHAALALGASREQILAVLAIAADQGRDAVDVALPILDELTGTESIGENK
jgi:alkylhydroperoxidase/carboxymuconolactone decarboxylase family protein YurZ